MSAGAAILAEVEPYELGGGSLIKQESKTLIWRQLLRDGRPVVVKVYRHLGLWNAIRGTLTRYRSEREYLRLKHLVEHRVPCTKPLAWTRGFLPEHGFFSVLVTEEVPQANSLDLHMVESAVLAETLGDLLATARRLHESGFCHQTLFPSNILVSTEAEQTRFLVSDVPRSWIFPASILGTQMALDDLGDLVRGILASGVKPEAVPLDRYGLCDEEISHFWSQFCSRRVGKLSRRMRDLLCRLRLTVSFALSPLRRLMKGGTSARVQR